MATGSRTLTLKLLADIDNFTKNTNLAEAQAQGLGGKIEKFGAAAKAAFAAAAAAAAAYAVKLGVDGVKAAIEDEAAQAQLARTLQAATGATNEQIAATEKYITKMQLATGVADTDLRKALSRLSLSTNDLTKSQELLSLALDISKATGKDLDGVANALGKAYDGQTTALGKLGIGLSSAELKTMSFKDVQGKLSDLFGGAAATNAETFQGKIEIMRERFAEFQESIGEKLIPILMSLFNFIDEHLAPAFAWLKKNAIDPVIDAINRNKDAFMAYYEIIKTYVVPILTGAFATALVVVGKVAAGVVDIVGAVAGAITAVVNVAIGGINALINAYNAIPFLPNVSNIPKISAPSVTIPKVSTSGITGISTGTGSTGTSSGLSTATKSATSTSAAASVLNTSNVGSAPTGISSGSYLSAQPQVVVNVSGAIDPESTARTIVNTLNNSFYRGTGGAGGLVTA